MAERVVAIQRLDGALNQVVLVVAPEGLPGSVCTDTPMTARASPARNRAAASTHRIERGIGSNENSSALRLQNSRHGRGGFAKGAVVLRDWLFATGQPQLFHVHKPPVDRSNKISFARFFTPGRNAARSNAMGRRGGDELRSHVRIIGATESRAARTRRSAPTHMTKSGPLKRRSGGIYATAVRREILAPLKEEHSRVAIAGRWRCTYRCGRNGLGRGHLNAKREAHHKRSS